MSIYSFEDFHCLIYCAALVCAIENGAKIEKSKQRQTDSKRMKIPPWQKRLENKIQNLRMNVNQLT